MFFALLKNRPGVRPAVIAGAIAVATIGLFFVYPGGDTAGPFPFPAEAAVPDAPPDSSIDAPPDAPGAGPPAMSDPWPRYAILSESTGSTLVGADGTAAVDINGDGKLDLTAAWEQSGKSTASINPGCASSKSAWPSVTMTLSTPGIEDSTWGDVDGDGRQDIISSGSSGFAVYVHFAPTSNSDLLTAATWTGITIAASSGTQRFLKSIVYDFDNNGHPDIIAGGYSTGANLDLYTSVTPRTAGSWTRTVLGGVGALYSLERRDMDGDGDQDLLMTDRDGTGVAATKGVRWMKNPLVGGGGWTNNEIYTGVGNTRWISASSDAKTILGGTSGTTGVSATWILTCSQATPSACNKVGGSAPAWTKTDITQPTNIGLYNQGRLLDLDGDADLDIVIAYHHAYGDLSNIVWLRNDGGGTYTRGEISGVDGVKSDNWEPIDLDCDGDLDIVTTDEGIRGDEAVTPLGLTWHENRFGVP